MAAGFAIEDGILLKYEGKDAVVEIPEGVQKIGEKAFYRNEGVTEVIMPDSVTVVAKDAFAECTKMKAVTFSNALERIEGCAFRKCKALKEAKLPNTLQYIDGGAFAGCVKMKSITCDSESLEMPYNPFHFYDEGECKLLFDKDGLLIFAGVLFKYIGNQDSLVIPSHVKRIAAGVFQNDYINKCTLKKVVIPDTVEEIGSQVFHGCSTLKELEIAPSVKIGENTFKGCKQLADEKGLLIVNGVVCDYFGDAESIVIPEGVHTISARVFNGVDYGVNPGNGKIKSVMLPDGLQKIGVSAFNGCKLLECINIPDSVTEIGAGAFYRCHSLSKISLPESVEKIGDQVFFGCSKLADENGLVIVNDILYCCLSSNTEIVVPEGVKKIASGVFNKSNIESVVLPSTLREIGNAFSGSVYLKEIVIPEGVTKIQGYSFEGCVRLEKVVLPSTVIEIEAHAFQNCEMLSEIHLPSGVTKVGEHAFENCKMLESMELPEGLTQLPYMVFYGCESLEEIRIPKNVEQIAKGAFTKCIGLKNVTFEGKNTTITEATFVECPGLADENGFTVVQGILVKYDGQGGDIAIPEGVVEIAPRVFREGTKHVGRSYYRYREQGLLTEVTLPSTVKKIHREAFAGCNNLKTVTLSEGLEYMGDEIFDGCKSLESIVLPDSVRFLGKSAFNACENLREITFPKGLKVIEDRLFAECIALEEITISANIEQVGMDVFYKCANLRWVHVEEENPKYSAKDGVLYNKAGDELIYFPQGIHVKEYTIPEEVTAIASHAFINAYTLEKVCIPGTVKKIGDEVFPRYEWSIEFKLNDMEVSPQAGSENIGNDIFVFPYAYKQDPLVKPKLPLAFVKDASTQMLLALGYCQNPGKYEREYAEIYKKFVKSNQKKLLKKATNQKLDAVLKYFSEMDDSNSVSGKIEKVNYKKLSALAKVELLERAILEGDMIQLKAVIEGCKEFEFTARALGLACLYGNLEMVKVLVEAGATFSYEYSSSFKKKYGAGYGTSYSTYPATYSLMLARTEVNTFIPMVCADAHSYHFGTLPTITAKENTEKERADIAEYLCKQKKMYFPASGVLYYAILWGSTAVAERLMQCGVKLTGGAETDLVTSEASIERSELLATLANMPAEKCLEALKTFETLLEGTGKQILLTQKIFEDKKSAFFHDEVMKFVVEKTDTAKFTKSKFMEIAVDRENLATLSAFEKQEWIKKPAQREKLIQYATDNKKKLALAWLMDYKNRTADVAAEAAKEEAKLMKELTEKPNSVAALKKIWSYKKLEDGTLQLTNYKGEDTQVEIPAMIGKAQVTVIGEGTFEVSFWPDAKVKNLETRKQITSIHIPEGITEIQSRAFLGCKSLENIVIPKSVKELGTVVFRGCTNLKNVEIPDTVKKIGKGIFWECPLLKDDAEFVIVGSRLFDYYGKETVIKIPEGVTEIAMEAFCSSGPADPKANITEIILPKGLQVIGESAFAKLSNLRKIELPDSVQTIGNNAFSSCFSLREIRIPASVTTIGDKVLGYSSSAYVHTPEGSYAEEYMKASYAGVIVVND